jgi:SAM-dependent methyltransferase
MNKAEMYDAIGGYITEIYDRAETQHDDVVLVKSLIGDKHVSILEPFCGHGRILIPLAEAGHEVFGLDLSDMLLESLRARLRRLPDRVQARVSSRKSDVIRDQWPTGFDVVILGGNCFYELATPEEQEHCIEGAAGALVPGGHLYLDNDHMEGSLDPSWYRSGVQKSAFPTGVCADGTRIQGTSETIWYDPTQRLARFRRTVTIQTPDGRVQKREWVQQKHPPSTQEMLAWLRRHGFVVEELWGNRHREPYTSSSPRAVFWARKQ